MASDWARIVRAAQRFGPSVDHVAAHYVNPVTGGRLTGAALLLKLVKGESGGDRRSVSSVGARGIAQFMPASRATVLHRYGVDPWGSPEDALHAAALHLRGKVNGGTGLEGYNPGGGRVYVDYILGQRVGRVSAASPAGGAPAGARPVARVSGGGFSPGAPQADVPLPGAPGGAQIVSAGLTAPRATPGPPLPRAFRQVVTGGVAPPARGPGLPEMPAVSLPSAPVVSVSRAPASSGASSGAASGSGGSGKVVISAGAERRGHGLQAPVLSFLRDVAGRAGRTVTVTTGTAHNQYVEGRPGVQSDHWAGNAADLGMGGDARSSRDVGRRGDLVAAHAIQVAAGVSFERALSIARGGGVHNFNTSVDGRAVRVQVIWRADGHFDHVHVGVAPR